MKESKYQRLFELMKEQHGVILLESEMQEIINECLKIPKYEVCSNCDESVQMISTGEICPNCKC